MDEGLHVGSEQDRDIRLLSGYFLGYGVVVHSLEGDPSQMTTNASTASMSSVFRRIVEKRPHLPDRSYAPAYG